MYSVFINDKLEKLVTEVLQMIEPLETEISRPVIDHSQMLVDIEAGTMTIKKTYILSLWWHLEDTYHDKPMGKGSFPLPGELLETAQKILQTDSPV